MGINTPLYLISILEEYKYVLLYPNYLTLYNNFNYTTF